MPAQSSGPSPCRDDGPGEVPGPSSSGSDPGAGNMAKRSLPSRCVRMMCATFPALFGVILAFAGYELLRPNAVWLGRVMGYEPYDMIGSDLDLEPELKAMFMGYDQDLDGYISLAEFAALYPRLTGVETANPFAAEVANLSDYRANEEVLILTAHFRPLLLDTMQKADDTLGSGFEVPAFTGLQNWKKPLHSVSALGVTQFQALLEMLPPKAGDTWALIRPSVMQQQRGLSSTRLFPAKPSAEVETLLFRMLSHFHPRPFLYTRFGPHGCRAVLMRENSDYVDILVRLHAEFQLNEPPRFAYWFTPGQFLFRVVMRRDATHIAYFHMHVPTNNSLNVDMEWINTAGFSGENMEVDIGFMPQMELKMHTPSFPSPDVIEVIVPPNTTMSFLPPAADLILSMPPAAPIDLDAMPWTTQVSMEKALTVLEQEFFDFKKVPYMPFLSAFETARQQQKLVHLILLWGVLDDQSC